jgi:hypothetical protein
VVSAGGAVKRIKDMTHREGANLMLEEAGVEATLKMAVRL